MGEEQEEKEQEPILLGFNHRFQLVHRKPVPFHTKRGFQVVIRRVEQPFSRHSDEEFNWLLQCLGFFEPIDKGKTAASVFRELVKSTEQQGKALTSTELAERVNMSRGAVINHLNNLVRSRLVIKDGSKYLAKSKSMFRMIKDLEDEIDLVFKRMEETAKELDKEMGLFLED